jgi:hypothetical protein
MTTLSAQRQQSRFANANGVHQNAGQQFEPVIRAQGWAMALRAFRFQSMGLAAQRVAALRPMQRRVATKSRESALFALFEQTT